MDCELLRGLRGGFWGGFWMDDGVVFGEIREQNKVFQKIHFDGGFFFHRKPENPTSRFFSVDFENLKIRKSTATVDFLEATLFFELRSKSI